jgi:hypothetical protein
MDTQLNHLCRAFAGLQASSVGISSRWGRCRPFGVARMNSEPKGNATELVIQIVAASVFGGDHINKLSGVKVGNALAEPGLKLHGNQCDNSLVTEHTLFDWHSSTQSRSGDSTQAPCTPRRCILTIPLIPSTRSPEAIANSR